MKNAIILLLLIVIVIMSVIIISFSKKETINYWYDINDYKTMEGKILHVEKNKLLIKSGDSEYLINHKSTYDYKCEQFVKIIYDGLIDESLPPQIKAIMIIVN